MHAPGLSHASLGVPRVSDGDLLWEQAGLLAPRAFCIVSMRKSGRILPWIAFSNCGLELQLTENADEVVDIAFVQPLEPENTQWSVVRIRAVWKWESEAGDAALSLEDETGARTVTTPPDEPGTLSLLWRRRGDDAFEDDTSAPKDDDHA